MNCSIDVWRALEVAREIIALAESSEDKAIAVTIVGPNGITMITMAMDGVIPISVELSQRKAYTSIMTQKDTLFWEKSPLKPIRLIVIGEHKRAEAAELLDEAAELLDLEKVPCVFVDSKITCFGGGVLVRDFKGNSLCAIGVSGRRSCRKDELSPPEETPKEPPQDHELALFGRTFIEDSMKS